jgi:hypothetical protein
MQQYRIPNHTSSPSSSVSNTKTKRDGSNAENYPRCTLTISSRKTTHLVSAHASAKHSSASTTERLSTAKAEGDG